MIEFYHISVMEPRENLDTSKMSRFPKFTIGIVIMSEEE